MDDDKQTKSSSVRGCKNGASSRDDVGTTHDLTPFNQLMDKCINFYIDFDTVKLELWIRNVIIKNKLCAKFRHEHSSTSSRERKRGRAKGGVRFSA